MANTLGLDDDLDGVELLSSIQASFGCSFASSLARSRVALASGMEITAEIKTGRRRVISYVLSPLQRDAHDAMGER